MPQYEETKFLPYTPQQIYDVVMDVEHYADFLPWCQATRVYNRTTTETEDSFTSDVMIGYKMLRERYTCKVQGSIPDTVLVTYVSGPFRKLENRWHFEAFEDGCNVHFFIDFEFKSVLLQKLASALFYEVVMRMVAAFEQRAHSLYSKPVGQGAAQGMAEDQQKDGKSQ